MDMPEPSLTPALRRPVLKPLAWVLLALALVFGFIFARSFSSDYVLFSNDAPLGLISAESSQQASTVPGLLTGFWQDLQWLGVEQPSILPSLSFWLYQVWRDPVLNAKFYAPVSLAFLGFCAWLFFRQLGFRNSVCVFGALAAALNMDTFSHAMWGLPSRALCQAAIFLALAAIQSGSLRRLWMKAVLGGMAVGLAIMEGFDVGALYSLYVAAFAFFLACVRPGTPGRRMIRGGILVAVIAISAVWFSAHALNTLIGTQIEGVAGMEPNDASRLQRWDQATMWSLPKAETIRVLIPGLFGYGMDALGYKSHADGSWYWGAVGQAPGNPATRHSGAGTYAGCLVVILGAFAIASAFRKQGGPFTHLERKYVFFWLAALIVSLLLAWGRHAPFYRIFYALPYVHTIRNPIKFMHMFHLALLILAAFGLEGLVRHYIARARDAENGFASHLKSWWKAVAGFDRKWVVGSGLALAVAVLGFLIYRSSNQELAAHLSQGGFTPQQIPLILEFTYRDYAIFLAFFAASLALVILALSGWFAGTRARYFAGIAGLLLVVDLHRANAPWIVYYNFKERYSTGNLIDFLRDGARDRRVTGKLTPFSGSYLIGQQPDFAMFYHFWLENPFRFYNIHSLEVNQMPRMPELDAEYLSYLSANLNNPAEFYLIPRLWQLTSTRIALGASPWAANLNSIPGASNQFRVLRRFELIPKHGASSASSPDDITTTFMPQGRYAIIEYTNALPRVSLFSHWTVSTNDRQTLLTLRNPGFDPRQTVLIASQIPGPPTNSASAAGTAEFANYSPKEFDVQVEAKVPSMLLVNDKFSPHWKAWIDGEPAPILRANFIMRAVQVPPGTHTVTFRYRPPANSFWITASAFLVAFGLCGFLGWTWFRGREPKQTAAA